MLAKLAHLCCPMTMASLRSRRECEAESSEGKSRVVKFKAAEAGESLASSSMGEHSLTPCSLPFSEQLSISSEGKEAPKEQTGMSKCSLRIPGSSQRGQIVSLGGGLGRGVTQCNSLDLCHSSASPTPLTGGSDLNMLLSFLSALVSLPVKWG